MATVYRAHDVRLQRPRAIKILSPVLAQKPTLRRRFLAEAQTMANLEDAHVVRVFDTGEDRDSVYIVMELVEGGSLLDRVERHGPLPARLACLTMADVCEGLSAAHARGIVHRDVKPHNILLTRTGHVRITDFGIAQVHTDDQPSMTRTGAVMGTWGYMAPEQKSNARTVDARADVYAAGATLWAILRNETPRELFMSDDEPDMRRGIPDPAWDVIRTATRYRRDDRYPGADAMAEALRRAAAALGPDPLDAIPLVPVGSDTARPTLVASGGGVTPSATPPAPATDNATQMLVPDEDPSEPAPRSPWAFAAVGGGVALVALAAYLLAGAPGRDSTHAPPAPPPDPPASGAAVAPATTADTPGGVAGGGTPRPTDMTAETPSRTAPNGAPRGSRTRRDATRGSDGPVVPRVGPVSENEGSRPAAAETPSAPPEPARPTTPPPVPVPAPGIAAPSATPAPSSPTRAASGPLEVLPPEPARVGGRLVFRALAPDATRVTVYYRTDVGGAAFQNRAMTRGPEGWTAQITVESTMLPGVQYFVRADLPGSSATRGGPTAPLRAAITP
jgi:serine/threonine protein kinase